MIRRLFDEKDMAFPARDDDGAGPVTTLSPPGWQSPIFGKPGALVTADGEGVEPRGGGRRPGSAFARAPRFAPWLGDLAAVLALCLLAVALTWPLALHPASTLPDLGDPLDSAWRMSWPIHQLRHDPARLLDANIFHPFTTTYLFDELILGVALVVSPVIVLSGNGVLAFNAALLLAFALNGSAMYLLARHLTGSRAAALAGALVYAAAPFRFEHIGHIGLSTAYWTPLALLFLDRALLRPRWRDALLFGGCVAMQALSAQYYAFQIVIVIGLYLLYAYVRRRSYLLFGPFVVRLLVVGALAELVLAPVLAPYLGVKGTWGYSRGLEENELYSGVAASFFAAPPNTFLGARLGAAAGTALGLGGDDIWLYPGLAAVLIALLGLARPRRPRPRPGDPDLDPTPHDLYPLMLGVAIFGAVMCLGPSLYLQRGGDELTRLMPYRLFFNVVPGFDAMRAPERFGNMVLLGLGGAVSFGVAGILARLRGRAGRSARPRALATAFAALTLPLLVGAEYAHAPLRPATVPPLPPVYAWLATQPAGPTIELPLGSPATELNREQVRQYWSTKHWQRRVNGSSDITPRAIAALRRDLDLFPDPRTLGILQGLGVRWVIVHRSQLPTPGWDGLAARYASYGATLQPRGEWGDTLAFELQPDERFAGLRRTIPPGRDVFLSGDDPEKSDAYMAMLGWTLRENRLITRIIPTFGQWHNRPEPGLLADYAIVYKGEDPTRYGYPAGMSVVYEDNVVRVHRWP